MAVYLEQTKASGPHIMFPREVYLNSKKETLTSSLSCTAESSQVCGLLHASQMSHIPHRRHRPGSKTKPIHPSDHTSNFNKKKKEGKFHTKIEGAPRHFGKVSFHMRVQVWTFVDLLYKTPNYYWSEIMEWHKCKFQNVIRWFATLFFLRTACVNELFLLS